MKAKAKVYWARAYQAGIEKGSLLLKPYGANLKNLYEFLNKLDKYQTDKGELRELDITIEVHYKKRTLDMNALMWALYDIEANEQNAGRDYTNTPPEERHLLVSPEELYKADIKTYAPLIGIPVRKEHIEYIKRTYSHIEQILDSEDPDHFTVWVYISTSHMDTKEHSEWINRQFSRLSDMGVKVAEGSDVVKYWEEWRHNKEALGDPERVYTAEEYKNLHPFCEACTKNLRSGGGSLAHISTRGMGRNPMEGQYKAGAIMHLCDEDHALFDNGMGRDAFIFKYPHMKNKINAALGSSYKAEPDNPPYGDEPGQIPLM